MINLEFDEILEINNKKEQWLVDLMKIIYGYKRICKKVFKVYK